MLEDVSSDRTEELEEARANARGAVSLSVPEGSDSTPHVELDLGNGNQLAFSK